MSVSIDEQTEWLEADGLGGFASGTTAGVRTRRYHALLLSATRPPTGRVVLVNGFDAWVDMPTGSVALTTQRYSPDVVSPDGATRIVAFTAEPWPTWEFDLPGGGRIEQELMVEHGTGVTLVRWSLVRGTTMVTLRVRPFLSGRDYHSMHHENGGFRFDADVSGQTVRFHPYEGLPRIACQSNGRYRHAPEWYRHFLYREERARGLDDIEDLAAPGEFVWQIGPGEDAVWLLRAENTVTVERAASLDVLAAAHALTTAERGRRAAFATSVDRAADAYIVRRAAGRTILAGYPWFTDWGRDTFIALRGLCLATGRIDVARDILIEWAGTLSQGMVPNRFPDAGESPEFNAVDASLWFVVAVHEFLTDVLDGRWTLLDEDRERLERAVGSIVEGYVAGTRFGIRMDEADGLLAAGVDGVPLTWMDAKVGDAGVTPRIGKPVEVQALWLNALWIASQFDSKWLGALALVRASFVDRFWIEERGYLADVVDVDHVRGTRDETFRPNQILAVGGLPLALLGVTQGRRVVDAVEARLLTPLGLRSLDPSSPRYAAHYEGGSATRDAAYHQGTAWPWLMGPFVEAWMAVRRDTNAARDEARRRFIAPLFAHLERAGLGHVSEITDADEPFTPRGCPFQAWSLAALLRLDRVVLAERPPGARRGMVAEPSAEAGRKKGPDRIRG